ncbi:MAG: DnaD domain protein [Lactobacillus sp.]|nr:DnaD domain protein [Lactobacillus sp.]
MFQTSDPKMPYLVMNQQSVSADQLTVLMKLYSPIIGSLTCSVYLALAENYDQDQLLMDAEPLYKLQTQLDLGLQELFSALHRLEAIGLIKTGLKKTIHQEVILFQLFQIPDSAEFFNTPLLASLLISKLGEHDFKHLANHFSQKNKAVSHDLEMGEDLSASFFEVFNLPESELVEPSTELTKAAEDNQSEPVKQTIGDQVDWELMTDLFNTYQLSLDDLKTYHFQLASLMETYGLNETELMDEILPTLHGEHHLNIDLVMEALANNFGKITQSKQVTETKQVNSLDRLQELSKEDQIKARQMIDLPPANYLRNLRLKDGGRVTSKENMLVERLRSEWHFSNELINLLIYTVLQSSDMLNKNLTETIANNWMKNKIDNVVDGLKYVNNWGKKKQRKAPTVKQKAVDWSKHQAKKMQINEAELNKRLEKYRRKED